MGRSGTERGGAMREGGGGSETGECRGPWAALRGESEQPPGTAVHRRGRRVCCRRQEGRRAYVINQQPCRRGHLHGRGAGQLDRGGAHERRERVGSVEDERRLGHVNDRVHNVHRRLSCEAGKLAPEAEAIVVAQHDALALRHWATGALRRSGCGAQKRRAPTACVTSCKTAERLACLLASVVFLILEAAVAFLADATTARQPIRSCGHNVPA